MTNYRKDDVPNLITKLISSVIYSKVKVNFALKIVIRRGDTGSRGAIDSHFFSKENCNWCLILGDKYGYIALHRSLIQSLTPITLSCTYRTRFNGIN